MTSNMKNHAELANHIKLYQIDGVALHHKIVIIFDADIIIDSSFIVGNAKNVCRQSCVGFSFFCDQDMYIVIVDFFKSILTSLSFRTVNFTAQNCTY